MRTTFVAAMCCCSLALAAAQQGKDTVTANPFYAEYRTPFQTPPFELIRNEHYRPAFLEGMERQRRGVGAIVATTEPATFLNTVDALERSGGLLERVSNVFYALHESNNSDELQKIAVEMAPLLSKQTDDIYLNDRLFRRVEAVYAQREKLPLNAEQLMLLETTYRNFVRGGVHLAGEQQKRFRRINEELSTLALQFEDNVLQETNRFALVVDHGEDLAGLPPEVIDGAARLAKESGREGKWVFTIQKPSMLPFLTYARNRSLREKIYKAYITKGDHKDKFDNKKIIARIAALRVERSHLLGYKTYADFALERAMAKNPAAVYDLLRQLWAPSMKVAGKERSDMQAIIKKEGGNFKLASWDWWYYADKVRREKYDLDENELRPYFLMDNVRRGAFDVATKLYGIHFTERKDIPPYDAGVTVFEVSNSDGSALGVLYTDYFPRSSKRAGAWCGTFRRQDIVGDSLVIPLVYNVGNFSRPSGDQPSLLSLEEVETLFHEFGHALHALFSHVAYSDLPIPSDFVELPSQIMERWAVEPDVLRSYARHYKTGEPMPQALIEKINRSSTFNQGFVTVEYLAASFLDMDWHTLKGTTPVDAAVFERSSFSRIGLMPEIVSRYRSTYFRHIVGGYAAGYYSYIWADLLVSDAFEAFREKGIFDQETAKSFRDNILAKGGSEDPMSMYVKFRGKKPTIEPLLKKRGLL